MNRLYIKSNALLLILVFVFIGCGPETQEEINKKPNIIYILADDLGYAEVGAYGQARIETPNIDLLSDQGMRFTQHYSGSAVCAPARCILLTGKHGGHAYIRGNHEWGERGNVWDYMEMFRDSTLEGQKPLPAGTLTLGSHLQKAGYKTAAVGKWGLGAPGSEGAPNKQGFDLFYGYNCQRQAHTYYPLHLYKNENRVYLKNDTIPPHQRLDSLADPLDLVNYENYTLEDYSPDLMFEEITGFVSQNKDNPFFLYWATPIPHAAIQAPDEWVQKYVEKFGDEEPYDGSRGYFPHRYPRAGYAAMVSYLDDQIGQLVQQLKDLGIYENTLIVFTSDNGPTYNGGTDSEWFDSAKPFDSGRGKGKGYLYEGGIRVPMIAHWSGKISPGTESDHLSAFYDVFPTLSEVAGVEIPAGLDGISFLPTLLNDETQRAHEFLFWEFPGYNGQQAIRMGDWKAIRKDIKDGSIDIELYDLSTDIREENNVADSNPDIVERMEAIFAAEHEQPELNRFRMEALGDELDK